MPGKSWAGKPAAPTFARKPMHDTAHEIAEQFFRVYFEDATPAVLEVGSQNVNGTLRDCPPAVSEYVGIDITAGEGVDIVLENPYSFPFEDGRFDAVISSSCFEHDQMFWLTFMEMVRVTKHQGYVYINVPSNGPYHSYPYDNWRFYPDAGLALTAWAKHQGQEMALMESFIARRRTDLWNDCVLVFCKGGAPANLPAGRVADKLPAPFNVRRSAAGSVEQFTEGSEDMILLRETRDRLGQREQELEQASVRAAAYEAALLALSRTLATTPSGGNDVTPKLQEFGHRLAASEAAMHHLRTEFAAAEQKQTAFASDAEQHYALVATETARFQREIAARDAALARIEAMLASQAEAAGAAFELLQSRVAAADVAIGELQADSAASRQNQASFLFEAEQKQAQVATEVTRVQADLAAHNARMTQAEAVLAAQDEATSRAFGGLNRRIAGSDAALLEVRNELALDRASQADRIAETERRETVAKGEIARLDREIAVRDRRISQNETAFAEQEKAAAEALDRLGQRLDAELAALTPQLESLQTGLDGADAAVADIQETAASRVLPTLEEHTATLERLLKWRRILDGMSGRSRRKGRDRTAPPEPAG